MKKNANAHDNWKVDTRVIKRKTRIRLYIFVLNCKIIKSSSSVTEMSTRKISFAAGNTRIPPTGSDKNNYWTQNSHVNKFRETCHYFWKNLRNQCLFSDCLPKKTIVIQPPQFSQEDEDELFGRTIALMLRNMPPIEKNLLKIQIFSCVAAAQNRINRDEYLV